MLPKFVQADCYVPPIQRIDFGTQQVEVVPWGDAHILVTPADAVSPQYLHLYSLSASNHNRPLLTLQLPQIDLNPGDTLHGVKMTTSLHPPAPGGHFRADPEKSMLVLIHQVLPGDSHPDNMDIRNSSHLLIPYATLHAQLDAVTIDGDSDGADPGESSEPPTPIPWKDWGSRTSLRLRMRPERELGADLDDLVTSIPLGSRLPLVVLDGSSSVSVYVFDIDPLAARYARGMSRGDSSESTAVVEDVEEALPEVLDQECAAIPFVVYRFALAPSDRRWIREVQMSLTGFAVKVSSLWHTGHAGLLVDRASAEKEPLCSATASSTPKWRVGRSDPGRRLEGSTGAVPRILDVLLRQWN